MKLRRKERKKWERRKNEVTKDKKCLEEINDREISDIVYRKQKFQGGRYERKNEGIKETKIVKERKKMKGMKEEKRRKEERSKTG